MLLLMKFKNTFARPERDQATFCGEQLSIHLYITITPLYITF